jgi:hypothetical protein
LWFFVILSLVLIVQALPYMTNSKHETITSTRTFFFQKEPMYITIEMTTNDSFVANNPIDIKMKTSPWLDLEKIRGIQVTLDGAEQNTPLDEPVSPESPPSGASQSDYDQYQAAMDKYRHDLDSYFQALRDSIESHIFNLQSDKNLTELVEKEKQINERMGTNFSYPKVASFSGQIQKVTYSNGGSFEIGLSINYRNNGLIGYELGDRSYAIQNAIQISPPETLLQIRSNNIMIGLSYIGVALVFLALGAGGFLEILKHFAFPI